MCRILYLSCRGIVDIISTRFCGDMAYLLLNRWMACCQHEDFPNVLLSFV